MGVSAGGVVTARRKAASGEIAQPLQPQSAPTLPLMLMGVLSAAFGFGLYACGMVWTTVRFLAEGANAKALESPLLYISGIPVLLGAALVAGELVFQLPRKRAHRRVVVNPLADSHLTVVLTAYNDEASIGAAVAD